MNQSSIQKHFLLTKPGIKKGKFDLCEDLTKKKIKKELSVPNSKVKSLLTPISQIPLLSSNTLSVIDSLGLEKNSQCVEHILTNIPAKEKYAELLDPLRSFPIPYHYKKLINSLETIDKAINYLSLTKQEPNFYAVSQYINEKCRINFSIETLQQILKVYEGYSLSWVKRNEKEFSLLLKFPEKFELVENQLPQELIYKRKQELHNNLLRLTEKYHEEFIEKNGLTKGKVSWHPDFDLQSLPEIELLDLPPKEEQVKSISNNEIIPRNALINSVFTEMHQPKSPVKPEKKEPSPEIPNKDSTEMKNRLLGLCETLKSIFSTMKTPSIFFTNLFKKLSGTKYEETLKPDILILCSIFPQWLSTICTNSGNVIRINKQLTLTLKSISEEISKSIS